MIKCEVVEDFRLENFKALKNIVRKNADVKGKLFKGDVFECDEKMAEYLSGKNVLKKQVVKIIEVQQKIEVKEEKKEEENTEATIEYHEEEVKPKATFKKKKSKKDNK